MGRQHRIADALFVLILAALIAILTPNAREASAQEASQQAAPKDKQAAEAMVMARLARERGEYEAAWRQIQNAVSVSPNSTRAQEEALNLAIILAKWPDAVALAKGLIARNAKHRIARRTLAVQAFKTGDAAAARSHFSSMGDNPLAKGVARLGSAWCWAEEKNYTKGQALLSDPNVEKWQADYNAFHLALLADLAGRRDLAHSTYESQSDRAGKDLRFALAYARHKAAKGDMDDAAKILSAHLGRTSYRNPAAKRLLEDIRAGKKPALLVTNATAGLAEAFFAVGDALGAQGADELALHFLQGALYLRPDLQIARLGLGLTFERLKAPKLAIAAYNGVPKDSVYAIRASQLKAFALSDAGDDAGAFALLTKLTVEQGDNWESPYALGNLLRSKKRWSDAVMQYESALARPGSSEKERAGIHYALGTCQEKLGNWPKAEAALREAIALDPNHAMALNYLGYSLVERREKETEAIGMLRRAVRLSPNNGYVVDSLGWAYFRLGDYQKAVDHLERAAQLRKDPVIFDHLGDAYWRTGRQAKAREAWQQAGQTDPEPDLAAALQKKLAQGLGAEAAGPVSTTYRRTSDPTDLERLD